MRPSVSLFSGPCGRISLESPAGEWTGFQLVSQRQGEAVWCRLTVWFQPETGNGYHALSGAREEAKDVSIRGRIGPGQGNPI